MLKPTARSVRYSLSSSSSASGDAVNRKIDAEPRSTIEWVSECNVEHRPGQLRELVRISSNGPQQPDQYIVKSTYTDAELAEAL